MVKRLGYVPALDGLRGIAILTVTLYHFFGLPGGFYGVDLFFVLSGFLITTLLLDEHARNARISARGFYERRARRLLPALGAMLVFCAPFVGLKLLLEGGLYLSNVFRGFASPDPYYATPFDHLWSLAEEEQFYLLWPLILILTLGRRRLWPWLAVGFLALTGYRIVLALHGAEWRRLYFAPDTHATGLILGSLAAVVRPRIPRFIPPAVLVASACFVFGGQSVDWQAYGLPAFELAAVTLVVAAADGHLRHLSFGPLVWLGVVSYGLYLWQQPARYVLGWQHPWIGLPLAFLLTALSYRYVEQPFRRGHDTPTQGAIELPETDETGDGHVPVRPVLPVKT